MKHKFFSFRQMLLYGVTLLLDQLLVVVCYNTVLAVILKNVINAVTTQNPDLLKYAALLAVITFAIVFTIGPVISRANRYAVKRTLGRLRVQAFEHALHAKVPAIEQIGTADVLTRLTTDIDTFESILTGILPSFVFAVLIGVIAVVMMFLENVWLALAGVMIGILSVVVSNLLSRPVNGYSKQYQDTVSSMTKSLLDAHQGETDIKMNQSEHFMMNRFQKVNHSLSDLFKMREFCMKRLMTVGEIFSNINQLGLIVLGLWLSVNGHVTIGGVLAVLQLSGNAGYLFQNFTGFLGGMKKNLPSIQRVKELFDLPQEVCDSLDKPKEEECKSADEVANENDTALLSLSDIAFAYPDRKSVEVLKHVSINVHQGEFVSIEGESGCGKSTLLKILLGFYDAADGKMYLNGYSKADTDVVTWRKNISYVPQDCYLYELSVRENLKLGNAAATEEEIYEACKAAKAHDFILNMEHGYDTVLDSHAANLSGGQRQRLAIARALLSKAPLLLLDEATSALDPEIELEIKKMLHEKKGNKAILCISHRKALIEDADLHIKMADGVVCAQ